MKSDESLEKMLDFANLVACRLEKLSVDSIWARRASGARRELVRLVDGITNRRNEVCGDVNLIENDIYQLEKSIRWGFELLENAAQEIPDFDEIRKKYQS